MEKKKRSPFFWLLGLIPVVFAALSLLALINNNLIYSYLGSAANAVVLIFPVLCAITAVVYFVLSYKKRDMVFLIFAFVSVVVLVAAFMLSNGTSNAKIQGDFLKHETAFNSEAARLSASGNGIKEIGLQELNFAVPLKKAEVFNAGTGRSVVFFYTFESASRIEGYVYIEKEHYPIAWDINYTEWSTPLDINKQWFYICIYPSN